MGFSVNRAYTGWGTSSAPVGDQFWFDWKAFMKGSGGASDWTVIASGDGLAAFSTTTDVITQAAISANGMANPKSWFILREPDNGSGKPRREILVFRPNYISVVAKSDWRSAWYSLQGFNMSSGWAGNAISATNPPIANDIAPANGMAFQTLGSSGTMYTPTQICSTATNLEPWETGAFYPYPFFNDTSNLRYAHLYKSDAAPWTFYMMSSTITADTKQVFGFWGLDKRSGLSSYFSTTPYDDGVFVHRRMGLYPGGGGSFNTSPRPMTNPFCRAVATGSETNDGGVWAWAQTRDQQTFASPLSAYTLANQIRRYGMFNAFRGSDTPFISFSPLLNSGSDALFPIYYYEGVNVPSIGYSASPTDDSFYSTYAGQSQLFSCGLNYKAYWSILSGTKTWLVPFDGTGQPWVDILWDGSAVSG
jgi:hypothetical protein